MSLFGSLYTGAAGMMAQAASTAMVSQNIANVSTTGYKRSEAFFHELVTTSNRGVWNGPGSVQATRILRADQQGGIQQTGSGTDTAIAGNGFFPVTRSIGTGTGGTTSSASEFLYTRNGAFSEDADGYLRNTSGMYLHGWAFDDTGNLSMGTDVSSLVPVQVDVMDMSPIATTSAILQMNLNAGQAAYDPQVAGPQQLPASNLPTHFSRSLTVYDGRPIGTGITAADVQHPITFEFRHIVGPMAHFTSNMPTQLELSDVLTGGTKTPGIGIGDQFTIELTASPNAPATATPPSPIETFQFVSAAQGDDPSLNEIATVQGLIDAIESYGTGNELRANIDANGRLLVRAVDPTVTINLASPSPGNPLAGSGTLNIIPDPDTVPDYSFEPDYDLNNIGLPEDPMNPTAYPSQADFPALANTTDPNPFGWWEVTIMKVDPADPTRTARILERAGLMNFNGDGSLNAAPDANGNVAIDLLTNPIDFDPAVTGDEVGFTVDVSRFTQFTGAFTTTAATQNGSGVGERTGVEISDDGIVFARFSNGATQSLFQIPLAVFANANGLDETAGTAFTESAESGVVTLALPGTVGAGYINPSMLENSNVDIADEFARMMVSQRGYGLSSKVISTIDQMTQRLSDMSR